MMPKAVHWIVGSITVLLCLAGSFDAYAQEPQALAPAPLAFEYDSLTASRLDEMSAEIASLKEQMAQAAGQTAGKSKSTGWSSPTIGGRFFMDYITSLDNDWDGIGAAGPYDSVQNWYGMREARLTMTGTGYDFLDYKLEIGFEKASPNNVSYKDIFFGIKNVPILEYVRIGNQYVEDAGSEICNGTTNYTFMETPAPAGEQFTVRRVGLSSRHMFADDRGRLFLGVYDAKNISDSHFSKRDSQGIVLNARLIYAPYFCHEGRNMFLFGAYYRYTNASDTSVPIGRPKPGGWNVYESNAFASFLVDQQQKAGFEIVYQRGRLCVQTDLFMQHYSDVHYVADRLGDRTSYGGFVMARLFLTGDYRKYNQKNGCWGSVDVGKPFRFVKHNDANYSCGLGAWEAAVMYGFYDQFRIGNPAGDSKFKDQQIGVALNWYWNQHVKWAVNYVHDINDITVTNADYSPTGDYLGMSCRVAF